MLHRFIQTTGNLKMEEWKMKNLKELAQEELDRVKDLYNVDVSSCINEVDNGVEYTIWYEGIMFDRRRTDGDQVYVKIEVTNYDEEEEPEIEASYQQEREEVWLYMD